MQINITGHQVDVTDAIRQITEKKFDRLLNHFQQVTRVNVTFGIEHLDQTAEATLHMAGGNIHASAKSNDMYETIDILIDKLDRQLIKNKEKHISERRIDERHIDEHRDD